MKPLTQILSTCFLVCNIFTFAQNFSFENINSNNVLNLLSQMAAISDHQKNSEIVTLQYGNQNYAEINTNSRTELTALQFGEYNYLNFDNSFEKNKSKNIITTEGNNNIIDVTGSNSISDKMQIKVKGDNMTIFMRNF